MYRVAAILKTLRKKFCPHFLEVHGGQISYFTPKEHIKIIKPSTGINGHQSLIFDPTSKWIILDLRYRQK